MILMLFLRGTYKSLECRCREASFVFLYKLLNGLIDSDSLVHFIRFLVPARLTRHMKLFYVNAHRTNYGQNLFVDQLMSNYNKYFSNYDILKGLFFKVSTFITLLTSFLYCDNFINFFFILF